MKSHSSSWANLRDRFLSFRKHVHMHLREYPLSTLVVMIGGWVLIYLILVTDNGFSQLLHMDPESFLLEGQLIDYVLYVGGYLLLLGLALALMVVGLGLRALRSLTQLPRSREYLAPEGVWWQKLLTPIGLSAVFICALFAAVWCGNQLAYLLPDRYVFDMPYTMADYEFESVGLVLAVGSVQLIRIALWLLWVLIPLSLALRTEVIDLHNPRHLIAIAVLLFIGGGVAFASPVEGTLVFCVVLYGLPAVVCGAYYLMCRSYVACVALCWIVMQTFAYVSYVAV